MGELLSVFILGLLSSAHCLGMCGGFVVTIAAAPQPLGPLIRRQLLYAGGRVATYAFMGALAGFAGQRLSRFDTTLLTIQQAFSILAGVLMLLIGASALGLFRWPALKSIGLASLFAPLFRQLLLAKGTHGYLLAGVANGFLPCGLVYAFVAKAVAAGRLADGASIMIAFGLGTVPAMVALGCGGRLIRHAARHRIHQVAACLVIVAGAVTVMRALPSSVACEHGTGTDLALAARE